MCWLQQMQVTKQLFEHETWLRTRNYVHFVQKLPPPGNYYVSEHTQTHTGTVTRRRAYRHAQMCLQAHTHYTADTRAPPLLLVVVYLQSACSVLCVSQTLGQGPSPPHGEYSARDRWALLPGAVVCMAVRLPK